MSAAPERTVQIDSLLAALEMFKELNIDMPLTQAISLLLIAKYGDREEGLSLKDLASKTDVGMASASRYVAAFGKPVKAGDRGMSLVSAQEDPMERRRKIIKLTPKGRQFIEKLTGKAP